MSIDKIGMYKTDEILKFMTEGEGRNFLGRSMFDAMYFEIERLNNIIKEVREYIEKSKARLPQRRNDFTCEVVYSDEVVLAKELLEILNKGE